MNTQWTVFAMLGATFLMTIYLGFKLGTGSEYREFAPGAAEQLANSAANNKLADNEDPIPVTSEVK